MDEPMPESISLEIERLRKRIAELELQQVKDEGGSAIGTGASKKGARTEGARMTKSAGNEIGSDEGHLGGEFEFCTDAKFIETRLQIYDRLKAKRDTELALQPREPIVITLPDGKECSGTSFETSPLDIATGISVGLAQSVIVARVFYTHRLGTTQEISDSSGFEEDDQANADIQKGELWDLVRPLEGSCKLELLKFSDRDAKMVFWHSSAHILGECMECNFGSHLTVGPPIDPGFYYDTYTGGRGITEEMKKKLAEHASKVVKEKQPFERIVLSKDEALELFADNPYKQSIINNKISDGSMTTAYRCGPLIDLCMGPHIVHTGKVKAFEITNATTSYWLGNVNNDPLQRVYGISFPDKKMLKDHKKFLKEAAENDHRKRGAEQKLFFFHRFSPGSAFFLPHGARIFNTLVQFIQKQYRIRGYHEVVTPNIYNAKLWMQSGHWQHYRDDMFTFNDSEKETFGLKPMNCPGHCLMFAHSAKSYRELPLRIADFGVLHRAEASGALSGLTRVLRFQQDDAHIFCAIEDVEAEVMGVLKFMDFAYKAFGMTYRLERSTRPAKACGVVCDDGSPDHEGLELWNKAEDALARILDAFVGPGNWKNNPGDGAFYGPKIDIKVTDSMNRVHQCATVQLDFQNPIRFNLQFDGADGKMRRPVIIHRAVLGSVERMFAILIEHFKGKWPFWLSPRQAIVICVHPDHQGYAVQLQDRIKQAGFFCDVDLSHRTMKKQIAVATEEQHSFLLIVGAKEKEYGGADVRTHSGKFFGPMKTENIIEMFENLRDTYSLTSEPPSE